MADEYIKREDAIQAFANEFEGILDLLESIPNADVRPVVHARWVLDADGVDMCSNCEANALQRMRFNAQGWTWTCPTVRTMFCPYCGARMDGADMREVDDG